MNFEELEVQPGLLGDVHIRRALKAGLLIERGTWDDGSIREASYLLRMGSRYRLHRSADKADTTRRRFHEAELAGRLEIHPGDTALVYTQEVLDIPPMVVGFVFPRGLLSAQAFSVTATYVDPGFSGRLYLPLTNTSDRIIELPAGMELARLFLFSLPSPVGEPWHQGKDDNVIKELNAAPAVVQRTSAQLVQEDSEVLLQDVETAPGRGLEIAALHRRITRRQTTWIAGLTVLAIAWPILLQIAMSDWGRGLLGRAPAIAAALLLAGISGGVAAWVQEKLSRRRGNT